MPAWFRRSRDASPVVSIPVEHQLTAMYQVYFAGSGAPPPDPSDLLRCGAAWRDQHVRPPLDRMTSRFWDVNALKVMVEPVERLPYQPPLQLLRHTGLGELEERVLGAATHGVLVGCPDLNAPPRLGLWSALVLALGVADRLDGVIFDPDALRIVDRKKAIGWLDERAAIAVSRHIIVPFSGGHEAGLGWLTTRGMQKFGLPDLELRDVPLDLDRLTVLMNAVAQLLVETVLRSAAEAKGGIASIDVPAELAIDQGLLDRAHGRAGGPEAGTSALARVRLGFDPGGRAPNPPMVLIAPPDGESDTGVWLHSVARALLRRRDEVRLVSTPADDEMRQAHARAVAELPHAKRRFTDGLGAGEVLLVKHPFATPDGRSEFLWVVVGQWSDDRLVGQIGSVPRDVPALQQGQTVTLDEAALFDWVIVMPGNRREGGYTDQIARRGQLG